MEPKQVDMLKGADCELTTTGGPNQVIVPTTADASKIGAF